MTDLGLLLLRLTFGGLMAVWHGLVKLQGFDQMKGGFPDPLGIGAQNSLIGAIGGELIAGALIAVGLFTRLSTIPAIFTMAIAAFLVHGSGPLFLPGEGTKEPALLYLLGYVAIAMLGPGRFSLDAVLAKKKAEKSGTAAA